MFDYISAQKKNAVPNSNDKQITESSQIWLKIISIDNVHNFCANYT